MLLLFGCSEPQSYTLAEESIDFSSLNQSRIELYIESDVVSNNLIIYQLFNPTTNDISLPGDPNASRIFKYTNNNWHEVHPAGNGYVDIQDFIKVILPDSYAVFQLNLESRFGISGLPTGRYKIAHPIGTLGASWTWREFYIE